MDSPRRIQMGNPSSRGDLLPATGAKSGRGTAIKSICAAPLKLLWHATRPVRRPIVAKFDNYIVHLLGADFRALSDQLSRVSVQVAEANERHANSVRDMNVFVDGLLREVGRLQSQMLALSQICAQGRQTGDPASWYEREPEAFTHSP